MHHLGFGLCLLMTLVYRYVYIYTHGICNFFASKSQMLLLKLQASLVAHIITRICQNTSKLMFDLRRYMASGRFFLRWTWADGFVEKDEVTLWGR